MTALGVISDVHGNLPALEAALAFLDQTGVKDVVCCGDVVGYGPWPNDCVERVAARAGCCVLGNHDAAAVGRLQAGHWSGAAGAALRWTAAELSEASRAFLNARPETAEHRGHFVVHGSPREPLWEYLTDRWTAYANFHHFEQALGWFGHSHLPTVFALRGGDVQGGRIAGEQTVALDPGARYLINPGSVGQPRDGDGRLALAVYEEDAAGRRVRFCRLAYPVERVAAPVRAAGLPASLYNRLKQGR